MIANRSETADIFGVAKSTLDTWRRDGCPVIETGGKGFPSKYDSVAVFKWLLARNEIEDYSVLLDKERYLKLKRENEIEDKLVAPIELLTDALQQVAAQMVPLLESLPLKMKRNNPSLTGHDITLVKKAVCECRNLIAKIKLDADD